MLNRLFVSYIAAGADGYLKVNSAATNLIWAKTFPKNVHRVDAGPGGFSIILTSAATNYDNPDNVTGATIYGFDLAGTQTAGYGSAQQYTPEVAIDEASQTLISVGYKNIVSNTSDAGNQPVVIPNHQGRAYDGTIKYTAYDWIGDSTQPNYINKPESNMADSRACRVAIGKDSKNVHHL